MCNLSEKIEEKGIESGRAEGEVKMIKMIMKMYQQGFAEKQIAFITEKDEKEIREILAKNKCNINK